MQRSLGASKNSQLAVFSIHTCIHVEPSPLWNEIYIRKCFELTKTLSFRIFTCSRKNNATSKSWKLRKRIKTKNKQNFFLAIFSSRIKHNQFRIFVKNNFKSQCATMVHTHKKIVVARWSSNRLRKIWSVQRFSSNEPNFNTSYYFY